MLHGACLAEGSKFGEPWPRRRSAVVPQVGSTRLFDDDARRRAADGVGAGDLLPDARRHLPEEEGVRALRLGDRDRAATVGGLADRRVERHLGQEFGAEPQRLAARPAMAEDLAAMAAMRAEKIAH